MDTAQGLGDDAWPLLERLVVSTRVIRKSKISVRLDCGRSPVEPTLEALTARGTARGNVERLQLRPGLAGRGLGLGGPMNQRQAARWAA